MGGLQGGGKGDPRGGSTVDMKRDRSTCPQVDSMFNEGIWNAQPKTWEGSAIPRTMEGDEARYTAFLLGTHSLQTVGCSTRQILQMPRAWVVLCVFHLTTAMGCLLGHFVDRHARAVTPSLRQDLQVVLSDTRVGWSVWVQATTLKVPAPPPPCGGGPILFFVPAF